jgi:hypothetical protein
MYKSKFYGWSAFGVVEEFSSENQVLSLGSRKLFCGPDAIHERWVWLGMNDGRNLNRLQELINWISGNGAFLGGGEQHSYS